MQFFSPPFFFHLSFPFLTSFLPPRTCLNIHQNNPNSLPLTDLSQHGRLARGFRRHKRRRPE